ncbi:MAG: bifunctional adenosylcobinamide kinase/adenosylcobinamide-phosphate guanylyltransferase [Acidimicrobiales bacterium]
MEPVVAMVIGGTRSGKSEIAEELFRRLSGGHGNAAIYIATGPPCIDGDENWSQRIAVHKARRPETWKTVEVGSVEELIERLDCGDMPVLVDSLTILAANWGPGDNTGHGGLQGTASTMDRSASMPGAAGSTCQVDRLVEVTQRRRKQGLVTMFVADEVGLSVHPPFPAGIAFQDQAGVLNAGVASVCDSVLLAIAGWTVELARPAGVPGLRESGQ